ncbi:MAG: anhydro-N-acetylmuramic acid kinase, partial [Planctomycetota bacterium]
PGNALLDEVATALTDGQFHYDPDGSLSSEGEPDAALLAELLDHPYLRRPPPKSTGREMFGEDFARELMERLPRERWKDLLATLARFTVRSIRSGYDKFLAPKAKASELIVSGGGVNNPVILAGLKEAFREMQIRTSEDVGYPGKAREALSFAILANETLHGNPGNVPNATGARHAVILGKLNFA